jgi:hypothetical protein
MKRTPLKRKTRMRRMHPETRYNVEAYLVFKPNFLRRHPFCECKPECLQPAEEIHHMRGRGRHGSLLCDERYTLAVSRAHHRWIHDHPNSARAAGVLGF